MVDVLKLSGVVKGYGTDEARVDVLRGVDLTLEAGEMVAIVGPSGCGKSTLMHVCGLLDGADAGRVWVRQEGAKKAKDGFVEASGLGDNELADIRNKTMGFVYQYHHLLREFTALENVMMPALIGGKTDEARAKDLLDKVGLGNRGHHYPGQLSGGEQQRVAIARALMNRPKILLADEPTGNLDPETADGVVKVLFELVKKEGLAVLLVTHNPALAKKCGRVLKVDKGQIVE